MTETKLPGWDLSDLYSSTTAPEIDTDFTNADNLADALQQNFQGKLEQGDNLLDAIKIYEEIEDITGRLASYAYLQYAENMADEKAASFYQNIMERLNKISSKIIFFAIEINDINGDTLSKLLDNEELNIYAPWLRDVRIYKPYMLSQELEEIFHEKSITAQQSWVRLFDETLADMKFPYDGKELSNAEIFDLMSDPDGATRKKAALVIGKVLSSNIKLLSLITNVLAKDKSIEDDKRGYAKPISSRNLNNLIEDEVVDALQNTVKANYANLSHRYYALKAKWMGVDQLDYWDRNAPLPEDDSSNIPYSEAVDLVLDAYGNFSPKLRETAMPFFDNAWIDVPPRDGKDSGAFAHPTVPSAHPYLLLNYQGKVRDVMTLAHELGHGVHQLLARKQGALMADTPLTLAETASVFGEQLTFQEILKREKNEKKRKIIIAGKVEDMLNTVVRQVAFCEFERVVHDERKQGEISSERLGEIWLQVQGDSLGPAIKLDETYSTYWSYIPHFIHSPFYVYSYAFGDCLVNALYGAYQNGVPDFEDKYFKMLEAGGTLHHKELLAPFGLDASKPDFWQKGLDVISGFIDELEG